jgi:hypothetical protein
MRVTLFDGAGKIVRDAQWDATTYTAVDKTGAIIETRPVTAAEAFQAQADTAQTNTGTLTAQARAAVDTIIASRETLRAIKDKANASIGPADTKSIARELMDTQKQLLAVLRLIGGRVDTTDTGTT